MGLTVGIDLGTTYSVIAYIDNTTKKPVIIKNKYGERTTPSAVGINYDGSYVIGQDAKTMEEGGDINTASFYKLYMGDHDYKITLCEKQYTACDLSTMFLKRLVEDAEKTVGDKITAAVITVPAYFEGAARNDTLKAGQDAGLKILNIINEPTAACVAYGLNEDERDKKILIYDLGGGTFDITLAEIKQQSIEVLGTNGHHQLGGRDWDLAIVNWLADQFYEETGIDISGDSELAAINMVKAEKAKQQLSVANAVTIVVDNGEKKCKFQLTRDTFESLTSYQLEMTTDIIDETFEETGITWSDLNGAILVGGSTKMPMVRNYLTENHVKILDGIHPDEAVAVGAAIQANISNFCALLPADKKKTSLVLESGKNMDLKLLPGAKVIKDVISHSLGMIMSNEEETKFVNDIMIKRNTRSDDAHTTKRRELRVGRKTENNKLDIYLLQGESDDPLDCTVAKKYTFYGIEYVDGGKTNLDITFLHTYNGTIDISAIQTETGKRLDFREEPLSEDMSWVAQSPKELYQSSAANTVTGALVMALDVSGSMSGTPIKKAKQAMRNFVHQFTDTGIDIGILAFASEVAVLCHPTKDMNIIECAIDALEVEIIGKNAPMNAGKNIGCGTEASPIGQMYKCLKNYVGASFIYGIALTDGEWYGNAPSQAYEGKKSFLKAGFELIGMGFGKADLKFLKKISTKSELASVSSIDKLDTNLSSIARIING